MGMGTMLKECVHSMMGSHKDVSDEKAEEMLQEMINSAPVGRLTDYLCTTKDRLKELIIRFSDILQAYLSLLYGYEEHA